jgi:hypothetical protein
MKIYILAQGSFRHFYELPEIITLFLPLPIQHEENFHNQPYSCTYPQSVD